MNCPCNVELKMADWQGVEIDWSDPRDAGSFLGRRIPATL